MRGVMAGWIVGGLLAAALPARADDWPQWAGPQRDGVWRETGIVEKYPAGGPPVKWRVPVGAGYTGPAVVAGKVYLTDRPAGEKPPAGGEAGLPKGTLPGRERVLCLDAGSGKVIWEHAYDCPYRISYPSGPRATPVVAGDKVYTLGAMGDLLCLDAATGKVVWERHFLKDFQLKAAPVWGWSAAPLLDGDRLVCLVGGEGSAVVAFHKDTGQELWRALTAEEVGYAPPLAFEAGGQRQLLIWHPDAVAGLNPETGAVYWSLKYPVEGEPQRPEVTIAAPRRAGDHLFLSSFYQGSLMLRLEKDKPGATVLWSTKGVNAGRAAGGLFTVMCTPVIKDGFIYGVCGMGELRCLKADTGERVWETYAATGGKKGLFANAFLIEQGGRFFLYNDQGDLIIAKLSPKGYEEVSRAHLLDTTLATRGREVTWCHPAFAGRCAFVRNDKELVCVSLAAEG
jgi:outer membrane protein assembly factor BamB